MKRFPPQSIKLSGVILLALTAAVVAPAPASAIDVNFSFGSGVTGIIRNLLPNINAAITPQVCQGALPSQCYVEILTSGLSSAPVGRYKGLNISGGFSTDATNVIRSSFTARSADGFADLTLILPATSGVGGKLFETSNGSTIVGSIESGPITYVPNGGGGGGNSSVPGPIPFLGAAAAFDYSRRLRERVKGSRPPIASAND